MRFMILAIFLRPKAVFVESYENSKVQSKSHNEHPLMGLFGVI